MPPPIPAIPKLSTTEFNALYDLYNSTSGPNWLWHNVTDRSIPWDFSDSKADPCHDHWQGLYCSCGKTSCAIQILYLDHHNMTGYLPDSIGSFGSMELLRLRGNNISCTIPTAIGNLTSLNTLDLSYNFFTGPIPPTINKLRNLTSFLLGFNHLTYIPEELYELNNLQALNLFHNRFQGKLSVRIGNLTSLSALELQINEFPYQHVPSQICNLRALQTIDLSHNNFLGPLPECFWNMTNLTSISMLEVKMECTLSSGIRNLVNLVSLDMSNSHLVGYFPESIGDLENLVLLNMNDNSFSGPIPPSLGKLSRLQSVFLQANFFTGSVPYLANLNVTIFYIQDNFLTGSLPLSSTNLPSVIYFDVSRNIMTGSLPWNPDWRDLLIYKAEENHLSGELPAACHVNVHQLLYFYIRANYLFGMIPENLLSNSTNLFFFDVAENLLTGTIPAVVGTFKDLNQLLLSYNYLTGSCPDLSGDVLLVVFDIRGNALTGTVSPTLASLRFLQELFLQENSLKGNINDIFNATSQTRFINIDVSSNQFTGTIPKALFQRAKELTSFAASDNCLEGSIPEEICQASSLVSLSLDGLTTAENCQKALFAGIRYFDGFTVDHFMQGSTPNCLFEMPSIELLHLSGNGLSGSIPSNLNISKKLSDLSLSYNSLTGTIPFEIQDRSWLNLDLSYNKLTGTLQSSFMQPTELGQISLQVNRLSGGIPSSLQNFDNVTILNGNIFGCNLDESDLPASDPDASNYSCGSDAANNVLFAWIAAVVFMPFITIVTLRVLRRPDKSTLPNESSIVLKALWKQWKVWQQQLRSDSRRINLTRLSIYFAEIRRATFKLAVYCVVILIPVYSGLKLSSASYAVEYAWSISGMLMNGEAAAISLFVVLGILAAFYFVVIKRLLKRIEDRMPRESAQRGESDVEKSSFVGLGSDTILESTKASGSMNSYRTGGLSQKSATSSLSVVSNSVPEVVVVYTIVSLINLIVMAAADFSYVYIVINYDSLVVTFSAFGLALFRLVTNNIILWSALPETTRFFIWMKQTFVDSQQKTETELSVERLIAVDYSSRDISFLENLTLFNNIVIPGIAIVFILPDCFYNALFAADSVSSSYVYNSCYQYSPILGEQRNCHGYLSIDTYTPPYIYTFQCSSKIVINYVPVYVIMFILAGIVIPSLKVGLKLCYDHLDRGEGSRGAVIRELLEWILPEPLKDLKPYELMKPTDSKSKSSLFATNGTSEGKEEKEGESLSKQSKKSLFQLLTSWSQQQKKQRLFSKLTMTVQINSYLTILMCFGALFPPLAVIATISIYSITYYDELWIGWLLEKSRKLGLSYEWYEEQLERESERVEESSNFTIWSTLIVSCSLYGYIIFDTMGDQSGWEAALPMTLLMVMIPIILLMGESGYEWWWWRRKPPFTVANDISAASNHVSVDDTPINPLTRDASVLQLVSTERFLSKSSVNLSTDLIP